MPLNRYAITAHRGMIVSPLLRTNIEPFQMTSRDALELAAWLVVMAETNAIFYGDVDVDESAIAADPMAELAKLVDAVRSGEEPAPAPEVSKGPPLDL